MELQHLDVKIPLDPPSPAELEALIPIFHQWIRDGDGDELLIDVADYRHVHGGPEVLLIGYEGNYSLDNTDGRPGLRYTRKTVLPGTNAERLGQAIGALAKARRRLEAEPARVGNPGQRPPPGSQQPGNFRCPGAGNRRVLQEPGGGERPAPQPRGRGAGCVPGEGARRCALGLGAV